MVDRVMEMCLLRMTDMSRHDGMLQSVSPQQETTSCNVTVEHVVLSQHRSLKGIRKLSEPGYYHLAKHSVRHKSERSFHSRSGDL